MLLGHEGTQEVAITVDEDLKNFLEELDNTGQLDNTITILLSDHGNHMSPWFYHTANGFKEQRLPFLYILVPKAYLHSRSLQEETLRENEQKLVTAFDVYTTLLDIYEDILPEYQAASHQERETENERENNKEREKRKKKAEEKEKRESEWDAQFNIKYRQPVNGHSLFKPNLPDRTCQAAGVPDSLCICS